MHPIDVAEFVGESFKELERQLQQLPELDASIPTLEGGTKLYVPFAKTERSLIRHGVNSGLLGPQGGPAIALYDVPDLGTPPTRKDLILLMDFEDFDGQPPTAELLLPDRSGLAAEDWPRALGDQGIIRDHPEYNRPFFCRRGLREYHSHPQHEDDPWDKYREALPLHALVIEILHDLQKRWIGK